MFYVIMQYGLLKITRRIKEKKMISFKRTVRIVMSFAAVLILSLSLQSEVQAATGFDQVAGSSDMAAQKEVEKYGMVMT